METNDKHKLLFAFINEQLTGGMIPATQCKTCSLKIIKIILEIGYKTEWIKIWDYPFLLPALSIKVFAGLIW